MANLCADPSVDIQLRLQLLETLELRSLGWRRHPAMADYYRSPNNYLITSEYVNVAYTHPVREHWLPRVRPSRACAQAAAGSRWTQVSRPPRPWGVDLSSISRSVGEILPMN